VSRRRCAECFIPAAAAARHPAVTGGSGRRQRNGGGDRRRQRTENTRFSTKFKLTQSCEATT